MEHILQGRTHHVTVTGTMISTRGLRQADIETGRGPVHRRAGIDVVMPLHPGDGIVQYMEITMEMRRAEIMAEETMDVRIEVTTPMIIGSAVPTRIASAGAQARDVPTMVYRRQGRNGWNTTEQWPREPSKVRLRHICVGGQVDFMLIECIQYSVGHYLWVGLRKSSAIAGF